MSRLPAILDAIMRKADAALPAEPDREARADRSRTERKRLDEERPDDKRPDEKRADEKHADDDRETIFNLLPPDAGAKSVAGPDPESKPQSKPQSEPQSEPEPEPEAPAAPASRNIHPIGISDLGRLSIDNDGRLYWDGKPVEVRRRIMMSRAQVIGASVIGAFVVIGALGAAIQASAAARDWACRLGWTTTYCAVHELKPAAPPDIPA
jgi:hypothetical protein